MFERQCCTICGVLALDVSFPQLLEVVFVVAEGYMGTQIWLNREGIIACESVVEYWHFLLCWCCPQ